MRNFFYKFQCAMARFMYGRNGSDQLNMALLVAYLAVAIVQVFFRRSAAAMLVCNTVTLVLALVILLRMFSRKLDKRRAENAKFLAWWLPVKNRASGARARRQDKEHKYFTCKNCKTICRVPVGKGRIQITCPKCGHTIDGRS